MADRFVSRRGVIRGRVGPRRATQWVASTLESAVTALAASTAILDQSFGFSEPATIVRVRGALWVSSDQNSATERINGSIGFAVVTDEALAVGVTAMPIPETNKGSDVWFLWEPFFNDVRFSTASGFQPRTFERTVLDSKAMRKVDDGKSVVVMLENGAATGMQFLLVFRMLVKLHG